MAANSSNAKWLIRAGIPLAALLIVLGLVTVFRTTPDQPSTTFPAVLAQDRIGEKMSPTQVYDKAWNLIKDTFYEQKFGGQDWNRWRHRYDGKLKTEEDAYKAIETMLHSLGDPYTRFLGQDAFGEEKSQIQAHLFGVGMQLGMNKEHKVVVIAPIQDTPAERAGIHPGDEITEVDAKPVKGQSLDQVVKQIRGEKGTKVKITFLRTAKKHEVELTRAEIPIKAVANAEIMNFGGNSGKFGYIRLDSFISQKANDEMREALRKVQADGAEGIILDLRNNPGGLLANAIEIANMFIDHGVIVSTIDSDGYKTSQVASPKYGRVTIPMVVLINQGSASASEILSGCLRDNHRAKLVGQKSFGKGLVQAINPLGDGSGINVTIAKYLTPADIDINKTGIVPEFSVELKDDDYKIGKGPWWIDPNLTNFKRSPRDGKDVQLNKAVEVLAKELGKPSSAAQIAAESTPATTPTNAATTTKKN